VAPSVTVSQATGRRSANGSNVLFTLDFSEAVYGLAPASVVLTTDTGATNVSSPADRRPSPRASPACSPRHPQPERPGRVATDGAGNSNAASASLDNTVTYDIIPPAIHALVPTNEATDVAPAGPLILTFDEPVARGTAGNLLIKKSADSSTFATIAIVGTNVQVSGSNATIWSRRPSRAMAWATSSHPRDLLPRPRRQLLPGVTSATTWAFTSVDSAGPRATCAQAAGQQDPTNAGPFATPSPSASGRRLSSAGVVLGGSAGATTAWSRPTRATGYTVWVSGMVATGTVVVSVAAGAAHDAHGNPSTVSVNGDNSVTLDGVAPTLVGMSRSRRLQCRRRRQPRRDLLRADGPGTTGAVTLLRSADDSVFEVLPITGSVARSSVRR